MTIEYVVIGTIVTTLLISSVSNVLAGGPRLDSPEDSTNEGGACWVDGYDSGFAGKYDKDRADECQNEENDEYNASWDYGCKDAVYTEVECNDFKNNPVEIEDFEVLEGQNDRFCYDTGVEDGKTGKPYNKERDRGCDDFGGIGGGYKGGYQFGCEVHTAESSCELRYEDKKYYCPDHPDVAGCVDYLHNATNKEQSQESLSTSCALVNVSCAYETNPEKYCLRYDDPYCKSIDICDDEGFVRPEYPHCTAQGEMN